MGTRKVIAAAVSTVLLAGGHAWACQIHELGSASEPAVSAWPTQPLIAARDSGLTAMADTVADPAILAWRQNLTGQKGSSPSATINAVVSGIQADVRSVAYTPSSVYVRASGVPSHSVGPFLDGNPAVPTDRDRTFRIPRAPQPQNGTKTATGLGAIGVMVNGVPLFNAADARSYNNQNVWHQNAVLAEAAGFDAAKGHPAPVQGSTTNPPSGAYHYHQLPVTLLNQIDPGNSGQKHSALLGYAFDGYPIYGPYGYNNADGTGGVGRMESSYQLRNMTQRNTLADGTPVAAGPAIGGSTPLGYYLEDFYFASGSGDLDLHNGRFTVTPEYPQGTYAYFATIDAASGSAYPYLIGTSHYGVVAADNLGQGGITVPGDATFYVAPEPGASLVAVGGMLMLACRGRRRSGICD